MSVNSSSTFNTSFPPSPLFSSTSIFNQLNSCLKSSAGALIFKSYTLVSIATILPICILILYLGLQRWCRQHSSAVMSHNDVFTYHLVIIELISIFGLILMYCGISTELEQIMHLGNYFFAMNLVGQMLLHFLTCMERYMAIVHPITYLSFRKQKWIRIRKLSIGCIWLLCFVLTSVMFVDSGIYIPVTFICIETIAIISICAFNLCVLCVLIRPGPGDGGGGRQQVDLSKMRALHTIMAILGVLLLRLWGYIVVTAMYTSPPLAETQRCKILESGIWLCLPSSFMLPFLFLQRAGKLVCCRNNQSGQGSD